MPERRGTGQGGARRGLTYNTGESTTIAVVSTHVIGIAPPDENWKRMYDVYTSCRAAGVSLPQEVEDYFAPDGPDESNLLVGLDAATRPYRDGKKIGYDVDLTKVPEGVTIIRFYNEKRE